MIKQLLKPVLIACVIAGIFTGCSYTEKSDVQTLFGYSLGTSYSIKLVAGYNEARNMQLGVEGVLANINTRMSTYLPNSDLSRFATHRLNTPLSVDKKTAFVVSKAIKIAEFTDGNFDPTIAPLVDLWGFGPTARNNSIPSSVEIQQQLDSVGYKEVQIDLTNSALLKTADRQLDLSAIAKGYAVDQVADYLETKGIRNYLVEIGGEMRFSGAKPGNQAWRIAVEKPIAEERVAFRLLSLTSGAIATSGDYRNFFEVEGRRFSHTIDPKTGYPIVHDIASVTVFMKNCLEADAYATAFMVMGRAEALAFSQKNNIATLIIYKSDSEFLSVQSNAFTEQFGEI